MQEKGKLISQMIVTARALGLSDITPIVLSDGGNLIVHLAPHAIVARIVILISGEDADRSNKSLSRELCVACHLHSKGVPVLLPTELIDAGPHRVGGTWMTFWRYVAPTKLESLTPCEAVQLVNMLSVAIKDFSDVIPILGVWNRACKSAMRLRGKSDYRIQSLLKVFLTIDEQMQNIETALLIPSHGDAHVRNLLASPEGWLWMDFEDVSLMPVYWDIASFVANIALFKGFQEPTFRYILDCTNIVTDQRAFRLALVARILMSTLGNLDLALKGQGDLAFATRQLDFAEEFILKIELISKEKTFAVIPDTQNHIIYNKEKYPAKFL